MKNQKLGTIRVAVIISVLLLLTGTLAFAGDKKPMTPELAAKKEMVQKQRAQRPSHLQKQTAADDLKSERLKVYNAKQAARRATPQPLENK